MVYIAYFTELILQFCDYAQKRRIWRENCKYALDENFHCHFCSDERLPSSATLLGGNRNLNRNFFFRDTDVTMARHKYVFTCWFVITITMWTVDFKMKIETSRINNSDLRKGGIGPTIRSSEKWIRIIKSMCCEKAKTRMMTMFGTSLMTSFWTRMMTIYEVENKKMAIFSKKMLGTSLMTRLWKRMMTMRSRTRRWHGGGFACSGWLVGPSSRHHYQDHRHHHNCHCHCHRYCHYYYDNPHFHR